MKTIWQLLLKVKRAEVKDFPLGIALFIFAKYKLNTEKAFGLYEMCMVFFTKYHINTVRFILICSLATVKIGRKLIIM